VIQPNPITEESATEEANGIRLHVRMAGAGYPLILLHGWPQVPPHGTEGVPV
jgi:pimeloyl-ACP methyl ester carboxylesterase